MLFVLQGPSGSGKTTQAKKLAARPDFKKITTATTRPPRKGEVDGIDYYFLDEDSYDDMLQKGVLLAPTDIHGARYGIFEQNVTSLIESKDTHAVVVLDDKGAEELREKGAIVICLSITEKERHRRLKLRGDSGRFNKELSSLKCHQIINCDKSIDEVFDVLTTVVEYFLNPSPQTQMRP